MKTIAVYADIICVFQSMELFISFRSAHAQVMSGTIFFESVIPVLDFCFHAYTVTLSKKMIIDLPVILMDKIRDSNQWLGTKSQCLIFPIVGKHQERTRMCPGIWCSPA